MNATHEAPSDDRGRITFEQRLLAETVRIAERVRPLPEPRELEQRLADVDSLEARAVERARWMPGAEQFRSALQRVRQWSAIAVTAAAVFALLSGVGTALAGLGFGRDEQINVFVVFGALLGPQTVFLSIFLVLRLMRPASLSSVSLGSWVLGGARRWFARSHEGVEPTAAVGAYAETYARPGMLPAVLGKVSHGLWVIFNVAVLGTLVFLFSTRHYQFVWETTILGDDTFTRLVRALAWLPERLGFDTPNLEQIAGSRWADGEQAPSPESTRRAWSSFLMGSVVTYGLLPRFALFALACIGVRRARSRYRLDFDRPGFDKLRARWTARASDPGVVDPESPPPKPEPSPLSLATRPVSPPAILALELDEPTSGWPPPSPEAPEAPGGHAEPAAPAWQDLGSVDDGDDRRRVLDTLTSGAREPSRGGGVAPLPRGARYPRGGVVCCGLPTPPDRGVANFLGRLRGAVSRDPLLLLTAGERLRRRSNPAEVEQRVADWIALAKSADLPEGNVLQLDLDHWTQASAARLGVALQASADVSGAASAQQPADEGPARRIEGALELVADHAARWPDSPSIEERTRVQRALCEYYGSGGSGAGRLQTLLRVPRELDPSSLGARLKESAQRSVALLPTRLKRSPRWLAAGAAAGAVGCIATALTLTPAAAAALPMWSAVGAAFGAALRAATPARADAADASEAQREPSGDYDQAVRAAALFALLLELQGYDEVTITRVLERTLDENERELVDFAAAQRWLEGLRHRLDLALTAESTG